MDRIERSKEKYKELFGDLVDFRSATDPEFTDILNHFVYGEVYSHGSLTGRQRALIALVVLAASHTLAQLRDHISAALNSGLVPEEIKEAIYHCAPYIGFPKTLEALDQANEVFIEKNISLPLKSQKQVDEGNRYALGLDLQAAIFGDAIRQRRESAPDNQKHIQDYLSAFCFGEIYTRSGLDIQTRELLTLCILSALGGCESQLRSHVQGNLAVGNDRSLLIEAVTQCMPFMGFPRTLNALSIINEKS